MNSIHSLTHLQYFNLKDAIELQIPLPQVFDAVRCSVVRLIYSNEDITAKSQN